MIRTLMIRLRQLPNLAWLAATILFGFTLRVAELGRQNFIIRLPAFVLLPARGIAAFPGCPTYRTWSMWATVTCLMSASVLNETQILAGPARSKDARATRSAALPGRKRIG